MTDAAFQRRLYFIMLLGGVLRLGLAAYAQTRPAAFDFPDSHRYIRVARNIAAGLGPIDSPEIRAATDPLYPALLSLGPRLGLDSNADLMFVGRAWNILFALLGIGLTGTLGGRLVGPRAGLVAATIAACDPISVYFTALVLTETCYTTFLLAALYCLTRLADAGRLMGAILSGICLGLGALARSSGLPIVLALAPLAWVWLSGTRPRKVLAAASMMVACAVVMTPTLIRNARIHGALVPIRIGSGASLLEALGPWADGGPGMDRIVYPLFPRDADEVQRDRMCRRAATAWARQHPREVMSLAWAKLRRTWSITIHAPGYDRPFYMLVCYATVAPVFVLALIGIWQLRGNPRVLALMLAPAAYFTLLHMVFVGSVRYRLPAMPGLFILAGAAGVSLWDALLRRRAA